MPAPGSREWYERVALMRADEARRPEQWWYMSFSRGGKFGGACVVRARGPVTAIEEARRQACNPGGEIIYFPIGQECGPNHPPNRLLTAAELGVLPGKNVGFVA